jgi:chromosome segregation protein
LLACHTGLNGIANQQQYLQERLAEGEQRRDGLDTQILATSQEHEGAEQRLQAARQASEGLRRAMEEREERALELGREITAKAAEFEENQAQQARADREALECRSRIASLREIEAGREGFDQTVRAVLQWAEQANGAREELGWLGPLADFIKVPDEALEWAGDYLAPALEWIVIREQARLPLAQQALEAQQLGGVRIVALDAFADARAAPTPGTLAELVEMPSEFAGLRNGLFGSVHLHAGGPLPHPLPKADGVCAEWLAEDGGFHVDHKTVVTLGRTGAPAAGILHRRAEISRLEERLTELERRQADISTEVGRLEAEAEALQARLQQEETLRNEQTLAMSRLEQEQEHAEREAARLAQVLEGLSNSRRELAEEAERFQTQQGELVQEARHTRERRGELEAAFAAGQERSREAADSLQALNGRLTERKVAHGQTASRFEHAANLVAAMEAEQSELAGKLGETEQSLAEQEARLAATERAITELGETLAERERALAEEVRQLLESTTRFDEEEAERKKLAQQTGEERRRLEQGQGKLHEVEIALTAETTRMEQWAEQMGEGPGEQPPGEPEDEQDLEKTLADAQRRLEKMEGVNLAAPEEYEAVATRLDFLLNQKEDLEAAIRDLEESIRRMNQESRRRFKETFDQVNAKFQEIFPLIFNGGAAQLVLTDSEDLLLAGVDIEAQPPGKKLQNLNLLSGGEKALTAIALIFSFFLFKPSPFCLLDEVDAPLDDVNVGRFTRLIQSMTDRSQFIIITHNKRTMEIGDTLYGVTMEEAGVSKIVSVNLEQ